MKCIEMNDDKEVYRVSDDYADTLVKANKAHYVPKHVWKREVRNVRKTSDA